MPAIPPCEQEHTNRASGSSGQHTTSAVPSNPSTSSIRLPPRQPITFNGRVYHNLPPELAAMAAALPSTSAPRRRGHRPAASVIAPAPVSFNYPYLFIFYLT